MGYSHATSNPEQRGRGRRVGRPLPATLAERLDGHLATFTAHLREGLLAASSAVGLEVLDELMDAEVVALAGPKSRHQPRRAAHRHGTDAGKVTLGGRRLAVRWPRGTRRLPIGGSCIETHNQSPAHPSAQRL